MTLEEIQHWLEEYDRGQALISEWCSNSMFIIQPTPNSPAGKKYMEGKLARDTAAIKLYDAGILYKGEKDEYHKTRKIELFYRRSADSGILPAD